MQKTTDMKSSSNYSKRSTPKFFNSGARVRQLNRRLTKSKWKTDSVFPNLTLACSYLFCLLLPELLLVVPDPNRVAAGPHVRISANPKGSTLSAGVANRLSEKFARPVLVHANEGFSVFRSEKPGVLPSCPIAFSCLSYAKKNAQSKTFSRKKSPEIVRG